MLTQVAVPVQVYDISHSSLEVGFVGLAGLVPIVVVRPVRRRDRRRGRPAPCSTSGPRSAPGRSRLALLVAGARSSVDNVALILGPGRGAVGRRSRSRRRPAARSSRASSPLDEVAGGQHPELHRRQRRQVVGPLIAGVLVTRSHGFVYAYGIDALLFTAALYSALRLPPIPPDGTLAKPGLRSVVDGLRFITTSPVLIMSFGVDIVAMVLAMPRSLFPQVAAERFHGNVGPLYAAIAIGAVIAGVSGGWIGRIRRQGVALDRCRRRVGRLRRRVGSGPRAVAGGRSCWRWPVAADLVSAVYRQTILQTYAPDEMRGRMQGVFIAVVAGGPRLGDVRAGATAAVTGPTFSWVAGGVACAVLVAIAGFAVRPFWRYDGAVRRCSAMPEARRHADEPQPVSRDRRRIERCAIADGTDGGAVRAARGRVRGDRRRGRRRAAAVHLSRRRRHRALRRGRPAAQGRAATCWCRGRTGCAAGATPSPGQTTSCALTEPAKRNAIHGLARWVRWTPLRDRRRLGDAGDRPGAADRLAVRGAGRGDLRAARRGRADGDACVAVNTGSRAGAVRGRLPPVPVDARPRASTRSRCSVPARERLLVDDAQVPVGRAVGRRQPARPAPRPPAARAALRRRLHRPDHRRTGAATPRCAPSPAARRCGSTRRSATCRCSPSTT